MTKNNVVKKEFSSSPLLTGPSFNVEAQELQGLRLLVKFQCFFPANYKNEKTRKYFEDYGVVFGEVLEDDLVFQRVELPENIKIQHSTDPYNNNNFWLDIIDITHKKIIGHIFYKDAYYDRRAKLYQLSSY
jgi:hypothetical protein